MGVHVLRVFGGSCIWNGTYKLSLYVQHTRASKGYAMEQGVSLWFLTMEARI